MLMVYNSLTREKEEFKPLKPVQVKMYVCGLTVQNYSHIGHLRSAINYDVIRRYLEYKGYIVTYIMNFTDINEKIVNRAKEEGLTPFILAEKYAQAYQEDMAQLNVIPPTAYVKATDNIEAIIKIVDSLIKKNRAYEVNGNVYFSVEDYADYGKLSGRSIEEMEAGARIEVNEEKRNPMDFALWKKAPEEAETWDSPWGKGWPGWHIECSAMSMKYLGESFDIHGGGSDLIFPHHENEIAQSEACTGKPFARYWLHNGTVNLKGEKMSKSIGNFYTTRELLERFSPAEIRYYLLTKHYRTPIDFSLDEINNAGVSLNHLVNTAKNMADILKHQPDQAQIDEDQEIIAKLKTAQHQFEEAMDNDFNSARAIAVLHELSRDINNFINNSQFTLSPINYRHVQQSYNLFRQMAGVLGLQLKSENNRQDIKYEEKLIDFILNIREDARQQKNWQLADNIRDGLQEIGLVIKDTPHGVVWERDSDL